MSSLMDHGECGAGLCIQDGLYPRAKDWGWLHDTQRRYYTEGHSVCFKQ